MNKIPKRFFGGGDVFFKIKTEDKVIPRTTTKTNYYSDPIKMQNHICSLFMLHPNNKLNEIKLTNTFTEMGMNSLDIMEIMQ